MWAWGKPLDMRTTITLNEDDIKEAINFCLKETSHEKVVSLSIEMSSPDSRTGSTHLTINAEVTKLTEGNQQR